MSDYLDKLMATSEVRRLKSLLKKKEIEISSLRAEIAQLKKEKEETTEDILKDIKDQVERLKNK